MRKAEVERGINVRGLKLGKGIPKMLYRYPAGERVPVYRLSRILLAICVRRNAVKSLERAAEALGSRIAEIERCLENGLIGSTQLERTSRQLIDPRILYRTIPRVLLEDSIKIGARKSGILRSRRWTSGRSELKSNSMILSLLMRFLSI